MVQQEPVRQARAAVPGARVGAAEMKAAGGRRRADGYPAGPPIDPEYADGYDGYDVVGFARDVSGAEGRRGSLDDGGEAS